MSAVIIIMSILVFLDSYSTMCLASLSFSLYSLLIFKVTYLFSIGSKLGKGYIKIVYGHPAYLTYTENMMPNGG